MRLPHKDNKRHQNQPMNRKEALVVCENMVFLQYIMNNGEDIL